MVLQVQEITGTARSVRQLLANSRYGLDYYQREYSWGTAQVGELVDDLVGRFLDEFEKKHDRRKVASYRPYCLGPIVTAKRDDIRFLVDGQQRVTTLILLLIYLRRSLGDRFPNEASMLDSLVFSSAFGEKTFTLNVKEREACLIAILEGLDFDPHNQSDSVRNLWDRYRTIIDRFPHDDIDEEALVNFIDWLVERVVLVDIGTPDQNMALEIFETMNDRGLRLSSTDMLKGFLLARVEDGDTIRDLNNRWRRRITELTDSEKNADSEFIKAWLRGEYAETQRQRKANAIPGDFDLIGTAFHKWVRDSESKLNLSKPSDYHRLVEEKFLPLSGRYLQLLQACRRPTPGLEAVYYNAHNGVTLQLPVVLAAITSEDSDAVFSEKAGLIAGALDIFVARRMVNYRNFGYSTIVYTMFNLMKEIRNRPVNEVRSILIDWLDREDAQLNSILYFGLTQRNRKHIRYLLARITAWIDAELGIEQTVCDYLNRRRKYPYEVEHIWANHYEWYEDEFDNAHEFAQYRNRIGDLVLLPKDFNASYGDMPYTQKIEHYIKQNSLVQSLHPLQYRNNPSFLRLLQILPFKPYPHRYTRESIAERQRLYLKLAELIWDPARIGLC